MLTASKNLPRWRMERRLLASRKQVFSFVFNPCTSFCFLQLGHVLEYVACCTLQFIYFAVSKEPFSAAGSVLPQRAYVALPRQIIEPYTHLSQGMQRLRLGMQCFTLQLR